MLLDLNVLHTVKNRGWRSASINDWITGNDHSRLNGFQSSLNCAGALISLSWLFGEAALDNCPETRRHWRAERFRHFAHNGGADLKYSLSGKWQPSGGHFIKHNSKSP